MHGSPTTHAVAARIDIDEQPAVPELEELGRSWSRGLGAVRVADRAPTLIVDTRDSTQVERALRAALRAVTEQHEAAAIMVIPLSSGRSLSLAQPRPVSGRLIIDREAHEVWADGAVVHLTAKEFALLCFLADRQGVVLTRQLLLDAIWGSRYEGGARTVDVHVRRLRRKLGAAFALDTVRGVGYRFCREQASWPALDEASPHQEQALSEAYP